MRILVTGANGLLGRRLVCALNEKHCVHALIHRPSEHSIRGVNYHCVDFATEWSMDALPEKVEAVIHLAQSSHFREFPEKAMNVFHVNIESTAKLLDYARRVGAGRFLYASSGGVYGNGPGAFRENSPITGSQQLGYYLASKVCGEVMAQSYASHMDVMILRPFFMYGAGQRRSMLLPRLVDSVSEKRPITVQGEEGIRINPVHVSDAVALVQACLELTGSQTINLAGSEILSIRTIAEIIGHALNIKPIFEHTQGDPPDLIGNNDLMCRILGRSTVPFRTQVAELIEN
jgi:nucleoside-diphosphate-sugar epimerase